VKKPVKTLADTKGMKIRVQQSDLWVALMRRMGANATPCPIGEVYTALKTGLVDAAENNYPATRARATSRWRSTTTAPSTRWRPRSCCSRKKRVGPLAADDQKRSAQAAKESVGIMRKLWDEREAKSLAVVKAGGARSWTSTRPRFQRRDEAGLRQVLQRPEAAGHGPAHPGSK
jgi:TRAP-type C4-dicarboxylate transport system substrate-binding protein